MTQKGIIAALSIAKFGKAQLRLVNVHPLLPLAFMDYVPAKLRRPAHEKAGAELAKAAEGMTTRKSVSRRRCASARSIPRFWRRPRVGAPT